MLSVLKDATQKELKDMFHLGVGFSAHNRCNSERIESNPCGCSLSQPFMLTWCNSERIERVRSWTSLSSKYSLNGCNSERIERYFSHLLGRGLFALPDATQKELKEPPRRPWERSVRERPGCNSERIESQTRPPPCLTRKRTDATRKELKGRPLSHRVSARVSWRFSWVRLRRLSIGFCDWASCASLFIGWGVYRRGA